MARQLPILHCRCLFGRVRLRYGTRIQPGKRSFQLDCARAFRVDRRGVRTADVAFLEVTMDREGMVAVQGSRLADGSRWRPGQARVARSRPQLRCAALPGPRTPAVLCRRWAILRDCAVPLRHACCEEKGVRARGGGRNFAWLDVYMGYPFSSTASAVRVMAGAWCSLSRMLA